MTVVWIVLGVVVGFSVLLAVISLASRAAFAAMKGPLTARIAARVPDVEIVHRDLRANNFGLESKGKLQMRGNGALVLTKTAIHFFQLVPSSELEVPLASLKEVSLVRSHLGKYVGYRLLKVRFETANGSDSIAWFVPNAEDWRRKVEELRGGAAA